MTKVAIGLGSNLGDKEEYLITAYEALQRLLRNVHVSTAYRTPPVGYAQQPMYLNAVVTGHTELSPHELIQRLKRLELTLGRTQLTSGLPREIDLDILLYGQQIVRLGGPRVLLVPHPQLHERWFAMAPLVELWPEARHPLLNLKIAHLLARIDRPAAVEPCAMDWQRVS